MSELNLGHHEGAARVVEWMMRDGRHSTRSSKHGPHERIGPHSLRGVAEPQEAFALILNLANQDEAASWRVK